MLGILFILGLVLIIKGGSWLVDSAAWFAKSLGIPETIVGATVISIGTTMPETMIAVFASLAGSSDIVTGTALGSVLANTGLIMAVAIALRSETIPDSDIFWKSGSLAATLIVFCLLARNGIVSTRESAVLVLLLILYIGSNIWSGHQYQNGRTHEPLSRARRNRKALFLLGGIVLLIVGARILLSAGIEIAHRLNVPEAVVAITMFSIGSSLPELATAVTAAIKGHKGLMVGNLLGASILNIVLVMSAAAVIRPLNVSRVAVTVHTPVILLLLAILIIPSVRYRRLRRRQGVVAFLLYLGYMGFLLINGLTPG